MSEAVDPAKLAYDVVLEALKRDVNLFVAMQYLGLIDHMALKATFGDDLDTEVGETTAPIVVSEYIDIRDPEPREIKQRVEERPVVVRRMKYAGDEPGPIRSASSQKFADWVEKKVKWTPDVFGWDPNDPLSKIAEEEFNR